MVTIYIYVEDGASAKEIAKKIIDKSLAAFVSISSDNQCFSTENEQITTKDCYCIKAHTRALLYNKVDQFISKHMGLKL